MTARFIATRLSSLTFLLLLVLPIELAHGQDANFEVVTSKQSLLEIFSALNPIVINRIHSWELQLRRADGELLTGADIAVSGGMPDHDHGLPTQPIVTGETEPGHYLLQGLRFHMPGRWQLNFVIDGANGAETALLEFEL